MENESHLSAVNSNSPFNDKHTRNAWLILPTQALSSTST